MNNNMYTSRKCKIFHGEFRELGTELNAWLHENNTVRIVSITQSGWGHYLYLIVIYS